MITITTATGKTFQSDYAVSISNPKLAFIRILGYSLEEVERIFSNPEELPIQGFEEFMKVANIFDETTAIKLVLKP